MSFHIPDPESMKALGAQFASRTKTSAVFALQGQLGAGKTHWTQGFVEALGSKKLATSPTFGILHEYTDGSLPVYHFDFYRMQSTEEVLSLGWDEILEQNAVVIVEWADLFPDLFPPNTQWLHFSITQDGGRTIQTHSSPATETDQVSEPHPKAG